MQVIRIFLRDLTDTTRVFEVDVHQQIPEFHEAVSERTGTPTSGFYLSNSQGKQMSSLGPLGRPLTLGDFNVQRNSTLRMRPAWGSGEGGVGADDDTCEMLGQQGGGVPTLLLCAE
eukprot:gene13982-4980_t